MRDFPGGPVLKTLFSVSTVSNKGSIPGWETKITHVCSWPKNKVVFFFFFKGMQGELFFLQRLIICGNIESRNRT